MPCSPWCLVAPLEWRFERTDVKGVNLYMPRCIMAFFFTIVDVQIDGWGVFFGDEKGFYVGINMSRCRIWYFQPQPLTTMVSLAQ